MGESKKDALRVNFDRKMKDKQKEMKKITVLGAGMVGRVMTIDLCRNYQVTVIDREEKTLTALSRHPLQMIQATSPISTVPHRPDTLSSAPSRISCARTLRSRV